MNKYDLVFKNMSAGTRAEIDNQNTPRGKKKAPTKRVVKANKPKTKK